MLLNSATVFKSPWISSRVLEKSLNFIIRPEKHWKLKPFRFHIYQISLLEKSIHRPTSHDHRYWPHQNSFIYSFVWSEESRKSRRVLSAETNYTLWDLPDSSGHAKVRYNNYFIESNSYFENLYSPGNSRHQYSVVSMLFYFDFRPYFGYFFFARSVRFSLNVFLSSSKTAELTQPWPTSF